MPLRRSALRSVAERWLQYDPALYLLILPDARRRRRFGGNGRHDDHPWRGCVDKLPFQHGIGTTFLLFEMRNSYASSASIEPKLVWRECRGSGRCKPVRFCGRSRTGRGESPKRHRWTNATRRDAVLHTCRLILNTASGFRTHVPDQRAGDRMLGSRESRGGRKCVKVADDRGGRAAH